MSKIIKVFPRKTRATPNDDLVRVGVGPGLFDSAEEIHISVTFTWDLPKADQLYNLWRYVAPTTIGGPAVGTRGELFTPGMYVKTGYIITSRGCPNKCWFCSVWKRDGNIREIPITVGNNILDDNLLACSEQHIRSVFAMLMQQPRGTVEFTGGLEAKRLLSWHCDLLRELKPRQVFFAYDTPNDLEPLQAAGQLLIESKTFTPNNHSLRCYVLCGFPHDTITKAELRMHQTLQAGFTPMAMAWRNKDGLKSPEWQKFQRRWARPAIIHSTQSKTIIPAFNF